MSPERVADRLRIALLAAIVLAAVALIATSLLWLAGALDEVEWSGDFVNGIVVASAIYVAIAAGFVWGRWRALPLVWAVVVVVVLVDQLNWEDNPDLSGIDDLPPAFVLPFTPVVMFFPAIGVVLQRGLDSFVTWLRHGSTT